MVTRRAFLTALGAVPLVGLPRPAVSSAVPDDIHTALNGPVGLQLWSVRKALSKDFNGTLTKVRAMGFEEVEAAGLYERSALKFRQALEKAGLRCQSVHLGYEQFRERPAEAFTELKPLGISWVVCPWIPHSNFGPDEARMAAAVLNRAGKMAQDQGLRLAYHCHGYEFVSAPLGTLFDAMADATDPALVSFQIDVLHAFLGGSDPAALITKYGPRVKSLHLKDLKQGVPIAMGQAIAPAGSDVPVGTGQLNWPAILGAAVKAGVPIYYIEDESDDPLGHIPQSVAYLKGVTIVKI
jgi:sugar phosphate isomerase/epimerase